MGGSISGQVLDTSGAIIPHAKIELVEVSRQITYRAATNDAGGYAFPNLPVGVYDLTVTADGFAMQRRMHVVVDTDSAVEINLSLGIQGTTETVQVLADSATRVQTSETHLGEVVSALQMSSVPLNGRSYTDLLSIQPGVSPATTLRPDSVIMAGVTGSIAPSGDLNAGNLSINGQRESANGFLVNGIDVQEHMNGGTSIVPDLDSIQEFRVLTASFDPEYGNYSGGIVSVVSKAGGDQVHGEAFGFVRNTALDARGYFDPNRSTFHQNQFGAALGGPVLAHKLFFFSDYQGTRMTQGISSGEISVPTVAERSGTFLNSAGAPSLTGSVSGPYFASLLSSTLSRPVHAGEPYNQVFPDGVIPRTAWSAPASHLQQYIPLPNVGTDQFATAAFSKAVRDDKGSARLDWQSEAFGNTSVYYFVDDYYVSDPYPGQQGGASIPGFEAATNGRAELVSITNTRAIGSHTVNELHLGILRNANVIGEPEGGKGISLASQGFVTGAGTAGVVVQAPQFEGIENISFATFTMGVPITNETQVNNTLYVSDGLTRVWGEHSFKAGGEFHADQVNEHPNATFNGTFNVDGTETGSAYADFLLGVASNFTQSSGQPFYLRNRYAGAYVEDSWRVTSALTLNAGARWDLIMPWWEKSNQLQTYVAGRQSVLYPGAPSGLLVAGDPGIPRTIAPVDYRSVAPRVGVAYVPRARGVLRAVLGDDGASSIRASYGIFYSAFPGLAAGIMYAVPPFGYNYLSPAPPLLAEPFITAATGVNNGQRFPFAFPPRNVSASNPDSSVNWSDFVPISADPFFNYKNRPAYTNTYSLSLQRQITRAGLLTLSYVGNEGHRLLALASANPGNPALCLSLPLCGPFGEDATYTDASGKTVQGTRTQQGPDYGNNTSDSSVENSSYNALETTLRIERGAANVLLSYTYSKSIDQGSNLGEQINPFDARATRALSAWDMRHSFVATYVLPLSLDVRSHGAHGLMTGWTLSGTTRFATGFPVTLSDSSDDSLLGTLGNGVNNYLLDTPQFIGGDLGINHDGRNGRPAFRTSSFEEEALGTLGNSKRRFFYGPGIVNFDTALQKSIVLGENRSFSLRAETFNSFNHAQFYGPAAVEGQIENPNFGKIVSAAAPRLLQLAARVSF